MKRFVAIGVLLTLVMGAVSMSATSKSKCASCTACQLKPGLTAADLAKIAEGDKLADPDFGNQVSFPGLVNPPTSPAFPSLPQASAGDSASP